MGPLRRLSLFASGACLAVAACDSGGGNGATSAAGEPEGTPGAVPRGARVLSIDVNEAEDGDFDAAFQTALSVGMQATSLSLPWDEVERAPGVYDNPFPVIANAFYSASGTAVSLTIAPIDTNNLRLPADLRGRRFDDPVVIERFEGVLDWVLGELPDVSLNALSIGNEIDATLSSPDEWARYQRFLEETAAHARSRRPGLRVGAKATYAGLTSQRRSELTALNAVTDVVLVTYYPLEDDFGPKDPSVVQGDLDGLLALYPGRPLMLLEAGYPSGELCGGSQERQARFVRQVFQWWDGHASQVELISFTWLTDISEASVEGFLGYYGVGAECFAEYLRTLGLRERAGSGSDKPAFRELRAQAAARGWPGR